MTLGVGLLPGEQMLWTGAPSLRRSILTWVDILFFALIALFFVVPFIAVTQPQPPATPGSQPPPTWFFLLPVVFFAMFWIVPRYVGGWLMTRGTRYVLTDRRAVITSPRRKAEVLLASAPYIELRRSGLTGATIQFAARSPMEAWGGAWWSIAGDAPAFTGIGADEAEHVYELIVRAREGVHA